METRAAEQSGIWPAATAPREDWAAEVRAVLAKDIRSELRTKAALATILLFALSTLTIISMTVKTEGPGLTELVLVPNYVQLIQQDPRAQVLQTIPHGSVMRHDLLSTLLWVILFFSAMAGLPRTFVKEEEMGTAAVLRLTARPTAVFGGKLLFNGFLMLVVAVVILPPYVLLFKPYVANWLLFLAYLGVGGLAMAGSATILGALVARAGGKAYLMLPIAFPLSLPILVLGINGSSAASQGIAGNQLVGLVSYVVAMVTLSAMLFDRVWSDA